MFRHQIPRLGEWWDETSIQDFAIPESSVSSQNWFNENNSNSYDPSLYVSSQNWFNENDPNSFSLPTTYDPVLINEASWTVSNSGLTDAYINQFQISPGTDWSTILKDIGSITKDLVQIGTPIASTILNVMKSNQVSNDSIAALSNSLKSMGINTSQNSLSSIASSLGISSTGKTDLLLQQEIALAMAKKQLEQQASKDDWLKYGLIGFGLLFGVAILKKI